MDVGVGSIWDALDKKLGRALRERSSAGVLDTPTISVEVKPSLVKKQALKEVHQGWITTRPARERTDRRLVITTAADTSVLPQFAPCCASEDHSELFLKCDVVGARKFWPFELEPRPLGPGTAPPVARRVTSHVGNIAEGSDVTPFQCAANVRHQSRSALN